MEQTWNLKNNLAFWIFNVQSSRQPLWPSIHTSDKTQNYSVQEQKSLVTSFYSGTDKILHRSKCKS